MSFRVCLKKVWITKNNLDTVAMYVLGGFGGMIPERILLIGEMYSVFWCDFALREIKKYSLIALNNDVVAKSYCQGDPDRIIWCIL